MKILIEYWEAALKLHASHPSSFLILLSGLALAVLAFEAEYFIASTINALLAVFILYLYVYLLRLEVHIQRDLLQKFINSLDD